jgi:hypothetical protein
MRYKLYHLEKSIQNNWYFKCLLTLNLL